MTAKLNLNFFEKIFRDKSVIIFVNICTTNERVNTLQTFKKMLNRFLILFSLISLITVACKKDTVANPDNTVTVSGSFTPIMVGTFSAQNGTPTGGKVYIGTDDKNALLKLGSDFTTEFGSGAATIYLSKGATYSDATVLQTSLVSKNGEQYFKLTALPSSDYTHVLVYCAAAKVPFGNASLKVVDTTSKVPVGNFISLRAGTLVNQNGTPPTKGSVQLGVDDNNKQFLKTSSDFITELSGAVTIYLSKGNVFNMTTVQAVSPITKNGEQYFKVGTSIGTEFTHAIIWCPAAKIPFAYVELK